MKLYLFKYRWLLYWLCTFVISLLARIVTNVIVKLPMQWPLSLACAVIYATVGVGVMRFLKRRGLFSKNHD